MPIRIINNIKKLYYDRTDVPEGIDVNKTIYQKTTMFVTVAFFKIKALNFNQTSAIDVMIY